MIKPKKWLMKQIMMRVVLIALLPSVIWSIYIYGIRALLLLSLTVATAILTEGAFLWPKGKPATDAAFVTGVLLALSLPPGLPLWMGPVGAIIAIVFGKMCFGGFAMNPFNPAMVGRAFIYLAFPVAMTTAWLNPGSLPFGGLLSWQVDALSGATPTALVEQGISVSFINLFFGLEPGSLGESSRFFLILGGIYLIKRKFAKWQTVVSTLSSAFLLATVLWIFNVNNAVNPFYAVMTGGLILGAFFIATDPVSSPKTMPGIWIYGIVIGMITVLVRTFGSFAEGFMFAILVGNMVGAFVDWWVTEFKKGK